MVNRLGAPGAFVIVAISFAGCSPAAGHSADAGPPAAVSPWATNAADVARFSDEAPFGPAAIVVRDNTAARTSPGGASIVATLPAGTDVVKLANHGSDDLVCFDEPKGGGRHLMGWVSEAALQDSIPPAPAPAAQDGGTAPDPPDPPAPHRGHHHRPHKQRHQ
jgi:hypothetical protein